MSTKTTGIGVFLVGLFITVGLQWPLDTPARDFQASGRQQGPEGSDVGFLKENMKSLEQRVKELETAQFAQEDATRTIIRNTVSTLGSKINEFVTLGGTVEVQAGWEEDFARQSTSLIDLATLQLDFEVQINDWTLGSFIIEYDDGSNASFVTDDERALAVDRINLDTGFIVIGDPQRFPPVVALGRIIIPFGISTGNPVADVLTLSDPMTLETFETRRNAILFQFGFPTPPLTPAAPPVVAPPVKPLVLNPYLTSLKERLGFPPPPTQPPPLPALVPVPDPPPFNAGIYFFNGETNTGRQAGVRPLNHFGATAGFRTKGNCGKFYDEWNSDAPRGFLGFFCPWTLDVDVDYHNSIFDSRFLSTEYEDFLSQIGFVGAMAASIKSTVGPVGIVAEWNGAIEPANFIDGASTYRSIRPSAWQVSLSYQFDWNPWVVEMGSQGTYVAMLYSESQDLAGVTRLLPTSGDLPRVGFVPKTRFAVDAGEWIMDNVRLAMEYSHANDYSVAEGGTGKSANAVQTLLTVVY